MYNNYNYSYENIIYRKVKKELKRLIMIVVFRYKNIPMFHKLKQIY